MAGSSMAVGGGKDPIQSVIQQSSPIKMKGFFRNGVKIMESGEKVILGGLKLRQFTEVSKIIFSVNIPLINKPTPTADLNQPSDTPAYFIWRISRWKSG